jgi:transcription elongation factor Elf1
MVEVLKIGPSATAVCGQCRSELSVRLDETRGADRITVPNDERQFRCPVCGFDVVVNRSEFFKRQ